MEDPDRRLQQLMAEREREGMQRRLRRAVDRRARDRRESQTGRDVHDRRALPLPQMRNEQRRQVHRRFEVDRDLLMRALPVVLFGQPGDAALDPRALVIGLTINGASRAYPIDAVLKQSPILDDLGGVPIFIVAGDDQKSVRAFERLIDDRKLEFFSKQGITSFLLVDAETGSGWDFTGKAISGPLSGKQLKKVPVLNDYWFDWKTYNPQTTIFQLGSR